MQLCCSYKPGFFCPQLVNVWLNYWPDYAFYLPDVTKSCKDCRRFTGNLVIRKGCDVVPPPVSGFLCGPEVPKVAPEPENLIVNQVLLLSEPCRGEVVGQ